MNKPIEIKEEIESLETERGWHKDEIADNERSIKIHNEDIRGIEEQIAALRQKQSNAE